MCLLDKTYVYLFECVWVVIVSMQSSDKLVSSVVLLKSRLGLTSILGCQTQTQGVTQLLELSHPRVQAIQRLIHYKCDWCDG